MIRKEDTIVYIVLVALVGVIGLVLWRHVF